MEVDLQVRAVLTHRKAQSACCGAPLDVAGGQGEGATNNNFTCRGCGQPTERVLGEPVEIIAEGNA